MYDGTSGGVDTTGCRDPDLGCGWIEKKSHKEGENELGSITKTVISNILLWTEPNVKEA